VHLDRRIDWREVAGLVERSYRMTAPKRVGAQRAKSRTAARSARPESAVDESD
jgi:hypothetical protein